MNEEKIYSDFHPTGVYDKFLSKDREYSMLDILNLAEQLMIGLLEFYLL